MIRIPQTINLINKNIHTWLIFLCGKILGKYQFNHSDRRLYLKELLRISDTFKISKDKDGYKKVAYKGTQIYWPDDCPVDELSWLYEEVFCRWEDNPSSYAHPNISLKDSEWVIDCGACEGYYTLYAIQNRAKKIITVEPFYKLIGALKRTFVRERRRGQVYILEAALGRTTGYVYLDTDQPYISEYKIFDNPTEKRIKIVLTTIDKLVKNMDLHEGGVIKMDIEGSEIDALQGAKSTLAKYKPKLAIAVYHGYNNAIKCRDIIKRCNPSYKVEFRGMYGWFGKPRPYMLFAM